MTPSLKDFMTALMVCAALLQPDGGFDAAAVEADEAVAGVFVVVSPPFERVRVFSSSFWLAMGQRRECSLAPFESSVNGGIWFLGGGGIGEVRNMECCGFFFFFGDGCPPARD